MLDSSAVVASRAPAAQGPSAGIARLEHASWAFTTRRVPHRVTGQLLRKNVAPAPGDLVLARIDSVGHHAALQLPDGRRKHLFAGDEIVVAYGNRYAPSQFEAIVPKTLGPCQLVAGGGVAAKALSWHARVVKEPTQITPIGLLADARGTPTNLRDYALPDDGSPVRRWPPTIAVVGTAMDSGKTQTAAHLVKGLTLARLAVGYAKVTGTGAGGDTWLLHDAGARPVLDFTDAGLVSTYLVPPAEIERVFMTLMSHLTRAGVDAIVLEVADGILQCETAALLESAAFSACVGTVLFAAGDAMGAVAGAGWLRTRNLALAGFSGVLTAAPLQREECSKATGLPSYTRRDLARPATAATILACATTPFSRGNGSRATLVEEDVS